MGYLVFDESPKEMNSTVVRRKTTTWSDKSGHHVKITLYVMKSLSEGFLVIEDDVKQIGYAEVWPRVVNLLEVQDGLYQLIIVNESRDFESGYIEDYKFKLIPYI